MNGFIGGSSPPHTQIILIISLMKTLKVIYFKVFNFETSIEFIQDNEGCIDVWHNTEDGHEIKINTFSSCDSDANLSNAEEWVVNTYMPMNYSSFKLHPYLNVEK